MAYEAQLIALEKRHTARTMALNCEWKHRQQFMAVQREDWRLATTKKWESKLNRINPEYEMGSRSWHAAFDNEFAAYLKAQVDEYEAWNLAEEAEFQRWVAKIRSELEIHEAALASTRILFDDTRRNSEGQNRNWENDYLPLGEVEYEEFIDSTATEELRKAEIKDFQACRLLADLQEKVERRDWADEDLSSGSRQNPTSEPIWLQAPKAIEERPKWWRKAYQAAMKAHTAVKAVLEAVRQPIKKAPKETKVNSEDCSICLGELAIARDAKKLHCGHRFHKLCIVLWIENHRTCPLCRKQTTMLFL